jgi:hypothetical protein
MSQRNALALADQEERLAQRISPEASRELVVSDSAGGLAFANVNQVMEFAKMMALGGVAVPPHLRAKPGACIAVCIQAIEWGMSPYSVANKSYSVNDRLAYEAQLVQAVILKRAPIKGRFKVEYLGAGESRQCRVWAELKDEPGEIVEYTSPLFSKILPKNSPLWKTDPDQQLFYYSVRAACRRHFPDVLLGVYTRDEIQDNPHIGPENAKDVTPRGLNAKLDALASTAPVPSTPAAEVVDATDLQAIAGEEDQRPVDEIEELSQGDRPEDDDEADDDDEQIVETPRDILLGRARQAATNGSKKLKFFLGKLSADEHQLLTEPDLVALRSAAQQADQGVR